MVSTRSAGVSEPLEVYTPPKRTRKPKPKESKKPKYCSPTIIQKFLIPSTLPAYCDKFTQTEHAELTKYLDTVMPATAPSKRDRDAVDGDDEPTAKRRQPSTPEHDREDELWMFGRRDKELEAPRTAPARYVATSIRQQRRVRGPITPSGRPSSSRFRLQHPLPKIVNESPFGSKTYVSSSSTSSKPQQSGSKENKAGLQSDDQEQRNDAPEPETPCRNVFGSLRNIGSATIGLARTGLNLLTPRGTGHEAPSTERESRSININREQQASSHHENRDDYRSLGHEGDDTPGPDSTEASEPDFDAESEVKRREFEARYGLPDKRYDHLHTIPRNGDVESLPYPPKISKTEPSTLPPEVRARQMQKKARRESILGPAPVEEVPTKAPLFGPNSHYTRGTKDPRLLNLEQYHPGYQMNQKRKFDDALQLPDEEVSTSAHDVFEKGNEEETDAQLEVDASTPAKRQKTFVPQTPRSALKKPSDFGTSVGRSSKSVLFNDNPVSGSRLLSSYYGPAGRYNGSMFSDMSTPSDNSTPSSIDRSDVISPSTEANTQLNRGISARENLGSSIFKDTPDVTYQWEDPNDPDWRPSLVNPSPGTFRVPDVDEEMEDIQPTPTQPKTPRPAHAELPKSVSGVPSEANNVSDTTQLALEKARLEAQKFKPRSQSRLSEVTPARSRSSSPPSQVIGNGDTSITKSPPSIGTSSAPAVLPPGSAPQPLVSSQLDNKIRRDDGMTDYEREHQYDDWAKNIQWDEPQTYEDAGTGTKYIHDLIRKNWTQEDSARSQGFWSKEFDEVNAAMELAKQNGGHLRLVTGMEDAEMGDTDEEL